MSYNFSELQSEVKRRGTRDQGGSQFTSAITNLINTSLFRLSRECNWKPLRRTTTFSSEATYSPAVTTSYVTTATLGSNSFSGTNLLLKTNNIRTGRRIQITGSTQRYIITSITSENSFTTNIAWDGTTYSGTGALLFVVFGTEDYTLPMQAGRIGLIWHEAYGYPFRMRFLTDFDFYSSGIVIENNNRPVYWRQWGEDDVLKQPLQSGVMTLVSSSSSDINVAVTVYGTVSGYPDQETITLNGSNGTTPVSGSKSFSVVERVSKDTSVNIGRLTVSADSASTTVAVIPTGNHADRYTYKHIQVWPLPNSTFPFNVYYYKDPARLVANGDCHELGGQFDEALILLAVAKLKYEQNMNAEGDKFMALYTDEVKSLKGFNMETDTNWSPALRRPGNSRDLTGGQVARFLNYSQLGGSFGPAWSN